MPNHELTSLLYALLAGIIPSLFWLWFWLREDNEHPEPKGAIFLTFFGGLLAIIPAIVFQKGVDIVVADEYTRTAIFAFIEEFLKISVVYIFAYRIRHTLMNEPINVLIYCITAALGFAAIENTLYIFEPIYSDNLVGSITSGNLRFIGATLVHVASTGAIGFFIALAFYRNIFLKILATLVGVLWGTLLHTLFNVFIIRVSDKDTLFVFSFVWFSIICLLAVFEFIKHIKPNSQII